MGNCCQSNIAHGGLAEFIFSDEVRSAEKELCLSSISISQWAGVFIELVDETKEVTCDGLAASFPDNCEFA